MELTAEQTAHFRRDGYIKLPGVVPQAMVAQALKSINHGIGEGIDPANLATYRSQTFFPDVARSDEIVATFRASGLSDLFTSLIGPIKPVNAAQIALRFPKAGNEIHVSKPHIDGTYSPDNGVPLGALHSFTALCHIMLSDVTDANCANFTIWPGTHLKNASYFAATGYETFKDNMPQVDLPEPVQITGKAGDAVIAHYLLGHSVAPHVGVHIRYGLFFRIHHMEHHIHQKQALTDPWLEWPGLNL